MLSPSTFTDQERIIPSLVVAVPTHSGTIDTLTVETLMGVQRALAGRGTILRTLFPSAAAIPMLRNLIVADFLAGGEDSLLMLDADQGLPVDTVMRMLDLDEPVVGCFYPRRSYRWDDVAAAQGRGADLVYRAMTFVGAPEAAPGQTAVTMRDGFVRAAHIGGGAMLVRRSALDALQLAYPELAGVGFDSGEFGGARFAANWGFFNPIGVLAEDFSFCERWRATGGAIWADATALAAHAGRHVFAGSYAEWLAALRSAD